MKEIKKSLPSLGKHFSLLSTSDLTRGAKITQSGRSMVEIIGVLAIIGVLSVAGIMGYSYAMDKHKANETINDVNLRMIDIMTHVTQGREVLEISSEFDAVGRSGYAIDLFQNIDSEPSIMVEDVPSSVCKMILKSTSDTQDIYVGTLNGNQVNGNWFLGDNEDICNGGNKEMLFALDESILNGFDNTNTDSESTATVFECSSNADCRPDAPYCDNGTCIQCSQDSHCPSHLPYCDTAKKVCHECVSNDDCDVGQFCADTNENKSKATPYTCKALNFSTVELTNEEGVTETWHYSNEPISCWDTKKACEAMGSQIATFYDLSTGEQKEGWHSYHIIRPHIKPIYKLFNSSNVMAFFATTRSEFGSYGDVCHLLEDGMFTCNRSGNEVKLGNSPVYGVCKK